jgi:hypothetical protein
MRVDHMLMGANQVSEVILPYLLLQTSAWRPSDIVIGQSLVVLLISPRQ